MIQKENPFGVLYPTIFNHIFIFCSIQHASKVHFISFVVLLSFLTWVLMNQFRVTVSTNSILAHIWLGAYKRAWTFWRHMLQSPPYRDIGPKYGFISRKRPVITWIAYSLHMLVICQRVFTLVADAIYSNKGSLTLFRTQYAPQGETRLESFGSVVCDNIFISYSIWFGTKVPSSPLSPERP